MITKTNLILFNIYLIAFKHPFPNIKWFYTSKSEIENTIKLIKTQNCCGYNKIHIKIPKKSAPFITSHLTCVFNTTCAPLPFLCVSEISGAQILLFLRSYTYYLIFLLFLFYDIFLSQKEVNPPFTRTKERWKKAKNRQGVWDKKQKLNLLVVCASCIQLARV